MTSAVVDEFVILVLADGRRIRARKGIADHVRGVDSDDDLVIPLGVPGKPIRRNDGSEHLVPLTPCCHATGKGSESMTSVVCRSCYQEVDGKYGGGTEVAVVVLPGSVPLTYLDDPDHRLELDDGCRGADADYVLTRLLSRMTTPQDRDLLIEGATRLFAAGAGTAAECLDTSVVWLYG